jgi:CRISPR-associated protein Cas2
MTNHFVVVCYDIPDDKRRTKLHNALCNYGTPVQYSVFECVVDARAYAQMQEIVRKIIKPRLDHVRYYVLCAACQARIETTRGEIETSGAGEALIV